MDQGHGVIERTPVLTRAVPHVRGTPPAPLLPTVVGQGLIVERDVWRKTTRRCHGVVARVRVAPRAPRWEDPGAARYAPSRGKALKPGDSVVLMAANP